MSHQLTFDLPRTSATGAAEFFVSAANRHAHDLVMAPAQWPQGKLALVGPSGSGKSHLTRIWAERYDGTIVHASEITSAPRPEARARVAVEDVESLSRDQEEALFHLHNLVVTQGGYLLLTATTPPTRWSIALPDLASRVQATNPVRIEDPDDALLFAVLVKLFADRQLAPEPDVIPWIVTRLERSYAAAQDVVDRLDHAALTQGRSITRAFARRLLDKDEADHS